jgi:mono/diheme cytochrome c family protein
MSNFLRSANQAPRRQRLLSPVAALALLAAVGCGPSEAPRFVLNTEGRDPTEFVLRGPDSTTLQSRLEEMKARSSPDPESVSELQTQLDDRLAAEKRVVGRQQTIDILYAVFGTPDDPDPLEREGIPSFLADPSVGFDLPKLRRAAGPAYSDEEGAQHGLYRKHCVHCHGITGDGAGPTARFLNPYPRDYRAGKYKFKSTELAARPTRDDLKRILKQGIPGTAMPSFILLPEVEIDALVEYVMYLSVRGEMEQLLMMTLVEAGDEVPMQRDVVLNEYLVPTIAPWREAESQMIAPSPPTRDGSPEQLLASIEAGRDLFSGEKAPKSGTKLQCVKCHGPTGLGDPAEPYYDFWNKSKIDKDPDWFALPLQVNQPRNLRLGIFRGGRRPSDIYRRIHAGINATDMPGMGAAPVTLEPDEIWNVVDYVLQLPYEPESQGATAETTLTQAPR